MTVHSWARQAFRLAGIPLLLLAAYACEKLDLTPLPERRKVALCCAQPTTPSVLTADAPDAGAGPAPASLTVESHGGEQLYQSYGCALCHGEQGHGDGQLARSLHVRPRDLHDRTAYTRGTSVAAVSATIEHGIPGAGMPPHAFIPAAERERLARYVLSLRNQRQGGRG